MSNPIAGGVNFYSCHKKQHQLFHSHHSHGGASHGRGRISHLVNSHDEGDRQPERADDRNGDPFTDGHSHWRRVFGRFSHGPSSDSRQDTENDTDSHSNDSGANLDDRDNLNLLPGATDNERVAWMASQDLPGLKENREDCQLPSTYDVNDAPSEDENENNYFAHPFLWDHDGDPNTPPVAAVRYSRIAMPMASEQVVPVTDGEAAEPHEVAVSPPEGVLSAPANEAQPETEGGEATRKQWGKLVDKIRVISNIQTVPDERDELITGERGPALVPYYAPVFEPSFISFLTDEYGRKLPPILLPMVRAAVTDSEYLSGGINQWVFRIELQYGDIKWVIRRTIADFVTLHYKLKVKSSMSDYVPAPPPFPDQLKSLISSARTAIGLDREDDELPEESETDKKETALKRRIALTTYLRSLLAKAHMQASYDICEFLEISAVSITQDMGWKGKEGFLLNRIDTVNPNCCEMWRTTKWTQQWVLLRDSYIAMCPDISSLTPSDVFLLDNTFEFGVKEAGMFSSDRIMTLTNQFSRINIRGSLREVNAWRYSLERVKRDSPWVKKHRYNSFAPIRHKAKLKWFVDGENHMNAVAEAILSAKSEIYIADWWLTPELYLRRPPEKNEEFRIDRLLQRKASEGVKIYIIIYKEVQQALTINSAHTKKWLQNLHPNIIVQRHPNRGITENAVYLWSHHEKIVIVDNRLAFIGGVDLCFGRYDTHAHRHADYPAKGHQFQIFPGQDYSSPRVKDFGDVEQYDKTLVDREEVPRMPWHDMSVAMVGPIARDVSRLFIQRWNFLKNTKSMHRPNVPLLMPKGEYVAARDESKFEGTCRVQLLRSAARWSLGVEREHSIYTAYIDTINQAKHFIYIENQFFITATGEDKILRNTIGLALVERIKRAHYNQEKFRVIILMPLIPAFEGDLDGKNSMAPRGVMHFQYLSISRGGNSIMEKLREVGINPTDYISWYSLRNWDKIEPRIPKIRKKTGLQPNEKANDDQDKSTTSSDHAEDEQTPKDPGDPDNETEAEYPDDGRDHYVSELVYIHDKVLIADDRVVIIGSANINDRSLLGNRDSEVAIMIEDTEKIPSYMNGKKYMARKFAHTLRLQLWKEHLGLLDFTDWSELKDESNNSVLQTKAVRGIGYGSAAAGGFLGDLPENNDEVIRSFERTEAVRLLDRVSRTHSIFDKYRHYRQEHKEELEEAAVLDPLSDHFYHNIWRKTAETNTVIYRELFRMVPDDTVHNFEQHRKFVPDSQKIPYGHVADPSLSAEDIEAKLSSIRGHLVSFPVDYLKDDALLNKYELLAPMELFT